MRPMRLCSRRCFLRPPPTLDLIDAEESPSLLWRNPEQVEVVALRPEARDESVPALGWNSPSDAPPPALFPEPTGTPDIAAFVAVFSGQRDPFLTNSPNGPVSADGLAKLSDELVSLTTDGGQMVTLEAFGHSLRDVRAFTTPAHAGASLPYGLFSFEIGNVTPGGSATVRMVLPEGAAPSAYFKQDIGGHLSRFDFDGTTGAQIAGNVVTLHYVDGGRGDDDGMANGVIVDPGGPGDPPVANADAYTLNEDHVLSIDPAGVLANDSGGAPLTAILVTEPAHGVLEFYNDGGFIYTPEIDYFGADQFTYKASDGSAESNVATVSLTINSVNDAPVANDDDFYVLSSQVFTRPTPGVMANDYDYDGDAIAATLVTGAPPEQLTLASNGSFTFDPTYSGGGDDFTYSVSDPAGATDDATLTFNLVEGVIIEATDPFADEQDEDQAFFTVIRPENDLSADLTVSYTVTGAATSGADYAALTGSVLILAGERSAIVAVEPLDDSRHELEEDVIVTVVEGPGYAVGLQSSAAVAIADDDMPIINIQVIDAQAHEDLGDAITFEITRSDDPVDGFFVYLEWLGTAREDRDYQAMPDSVYFSPGVSSIPLTVSVLDDQYDDPDETVALNIIPNPWSTEQVYAIGSSGTALGSILAGAGDAAAFVTIEVTDANASEADPNDTITLTFRRTGSLAQELWVRYNVEGTAAAVVDYAPFWAPAPASGHVKFPIGVAVVTQTIQAVNDLIDEVLESVIVTFIDCDVFQYDYAPVRTGFPAPPGSTGTGWVHSDPPPMPDPYPILAIVANDPEAVDLSLDPGQFTVSREGGHWSQPLTVNFTRSGSLDKGLYRLYDASGGLISEDDVSLLSYVTIPADLGSTPITVDAFGDMPDEVLEKTVILTLTGAAGGHELAAGGRSSATVKVQNPEVKIDPVTSQTEIKPDSPINKIKNPAGIVILDSKLPGSDFSLQQNNTAIIEITTTNFQIAEDPTTSPVEWRFVAVPEQEDPAGVAKFYEPQPGQPDRYGKTVHVYGVNAGRILVQVVHRATGKVLTDYDAYVVGRQFMFFRVNLLSGTTPNVGTLTKQAAQSQDHISIANVYFRQVGIDLVPTLLPATAPAVDTNLPGYFTATVADDLVEGVRDRKGLQTIAVNALPHYVQISYIDSVDKPATPGRTVFIADNRAGTLNQQGRRELERTFRIVVEDDRQKHRMRLMSPKSGDRLLLDPKTWGILITNSRGDPVAHRQDYGSVIAHELSHVLMVGHRLATGDLLEKPGRKNLMYPVFDGGTIQVPFPVLEDLDLIQLVAARGSHALSGRG